MVRITRTACALTGFFAVTGSVPASETRDAGGSGQGSDLAGIPAPGNSPGEQG